MASHNKRPMKSFFKEALKSFKTTGTFKPSSPRLIETISSQIDFEKAQNIIEFGPGNGCITEVLVKKMAPSTRLMSLEINDQFFNYCTDLFKNNDQVTILKESAFDIEEILKSRHIEKVDYIVSSLPLALFSKSDTEDLLGLMTDLLKPKGIFIQYQYSLGSYRMMKDIFDDVRLSFTLRNTPPAFVYTCTTG